MTSSEKPKKISKSSKNSIRERRRQARQKRKLKKKLEEKKRLEKLNRLYQNFPPRSSEVFEDEYDETHESHEPREPIVLEKRARGVRKVISDRPCDECGGGPYQSQRMAVYYKTNVGEVAICDDCIDNVKERSGRYVDAFRGAFLGGGFSPR